MEIRLLSRDEIDKVKFNSCVHYATNGNIFGYIWFLDQVAKDWVALVEDDYQSVFPLVWRTDNFGRQNLYQPALMRELGIYSIHVLSPPRIAAFLNAIPDTYRKIDIHLNEQNRPPTDLDGFQVEELTNHQLLLSRPYEEIASSFSPEVKAALTLAEDSDLLPTTSIKPEQLAALYREHTTHSGRITEQFHALQRIMYNALHRGWGFASGVQTRDGELLAANFYLYSHHRVMSLAPVQSPAGRKKGALTYLIDTLLRSHAERPLLLDFNTRDKQDRLALGFGALATPYYRLHRKQGWW